MLYGLSQIGYIVASVCFILALHWMNTPATARNGVYAGVAGTAIAILVTWADPARRPSPVDHRRDRRRDFSSACRSRACR